MLMKYLTLTFMELYSVPKGLSSLRHIDILGLLKSFVRGYLLLPWSENFQ